MIINKVVICPICGKKTYLRIEDGGYLKEYPIRVHCYNCRAMIQGCYGMGSASSRNGLHIGNASTEDCDVDPVTYKIHNADYVVDISGELPCKKVRVFDGHLISSSPFLDATDQVDILERIERLRYFIKNLEEWKAWRSIAFQLLDEGSIDYISTAIRNKMGDYSYECNDYLKSLHCLQEVVQEETKSLFIMPCQDECISNLIGVLSKIDREQLHAFIEHIGGIQEIITAYRKAVDVFSSFMGVYPNVLPAETYMRFKDKDKEDLGIATCTFGDIKTFYQDAYETLISMLVFPVCLDNIILRGSFKVFNAEFISLFTSRKYCDYADDFNRYTALDNGMKLDKIQQREPVQHIISLPANRFLRNGIGHNSICYDGLTQTVTVFDIKNPGRVKLTKSLMSMAIDCIGLTKSAVLMAELLLFVIRQETRSEEMHSIIHPRFYSGIGPNDRCPCGSDLKYKKCCKNEVDALLQNSRMRKQE